MERMPTIEELESALDSNPEPEIDPELAALEALDPPEEPAPDSPEPETLPEPEEEPAPTPAAVAVAPVALADLNSLRAVVGRQKVQGGSPLVSSTGSFTEPPSRDRLPGDLPASQGFDHSAFQDDLSDGKVRNFDDLFSRFPIGDGEFEIYVDRRSPNIFRGAKISGMQKSIKDKMDHETFAKTYGSGVYLLTVYGPSPGRRLDKEGNLSRKAFTKPIKVEVPDPFQQNPPVLAMAEVGVEQEDDNMPEFRKGGATEADAEIKKAELESELTREERARNWEEKKQEREERKAAQRLAEEREAQQSQQGALERILSEQAAELRELRNKPPAEASLLGSMSQLLAVVKPEGPSVSEIHRLQSESAQLRASHTEELNRLRGEHQKEIDRLRDDSARHEREIRENKDREMRDREDALRARIDDLQKERDRRITELNEAHATKLADERRQHDRDLQVAQSMQNQSSTTISSTFEMRLEVKQQEINRLSQDLATTRSELELEKSKTLADRVEEFAGAAEALGYAKDDGGEKGWKDMLGEAAIGLVQNVPALAASVASSLRPQQMPMLSAPGAGAHLPQRQSYAPVFATDGVDADLNYQSNAPIDHNVIYPGQDPLGEFEEEEDEFEPEAPPRARAPKAAPAKPPAPPAALAQPLPPAPAGSMGITDENILEFSEGFRKAFTDGTAPEDFVDEIIGQLGPMLSGSIVKEVQIPRVLGLLQNAPNGETDPLVRRDGQKFLHKVWELIEKKTVAG